MSTLSTSDTLKRDRYRPPSRFVPGTVVTRLGTLQEVGPSPLVIDPSLITDT